MTIGLKKINPEINVFYSHLLGVEKITSYFQVVLFADTNQICGRIFRFLRCTTFSCFKADSTCAITASIIIFYYRESEKMYSP